MSTPQTRLLFSGRRRVASLFAGSIWREQKTLGKAALAHAIAGWSAAWIATLAIASQMVVALAPSAAWAQALWTGNAETGSGAVIDHTDASYPLIQSDVFSEGGHAYHLAHPGTTSNSFEIDQTIAVGSNTKLFFQSRLGWATSAQRAKVQLSTNGGATWPVDLYSQAGSGGSGEGSFSLRQIDLSPYASQNVRFRFLYDLAFGNRFPQTDPGVGWYVDDIQIADALQKTLFSIGNPTEHEQLYLEFINRSRADALVEASRLAQETDPDVVQALNFFNVQRSDIENQFAWYVDQGHIPLHAQPLSFSPQLIEAARWHSQDMLDNSFQGHNSSANPPGPFPPNAGLGQRLDAVGFQGQSFGENVFSFARSVAHGHAGFDVDWGDVVNVGPAYNPAFDGQGMQNAAGHRLNLHNGSFNEIGVGVVLGTNQDVGPMIVTQDLGSTGAAYVTGVVYEDLNGNAFYDLGEGRPGVRVDVDGSGFYAVSSSSGGYSIPVSGSGAAQVVFSGGGFAEFATTVQLAGMSVKVDYLVQSAPSFAADFDGDGDVDANDLNVWRTSLVQSAAADADGDADSDGADFLIWQRELGSGLSQIARAVPEPAALWLAGAAGVAALLRRRRTR